MKLIINIPDISYNSTLKNGELSIMNDNDIYNMIANGIPLDNATNGDVIKAMFDLKKETDMSNTYCVCFHEEGEDYCHYFFKEWWNAPYQKGDKE